MSNVGYNPAIHTGVNLGGYHCTVGSKAYRMLYAYNDAGRPDVTGANLRVGQNIIYNGKTRIFAGIESAGVNHMRRGEFYASNASIGIIAFLETAVIPTNWTHLEVVRVGAAKTSVTVRPVVGSFTELFSHHFFPRPITSYNYPAEFAGVQIPTSTATAVVEKSVEEMDADALLARLTQDVRSGSLDVTRLQEKIDNIKKLLVQKEALEARRLALKSESDALVVRMRQMFGSQAKAVGAGIVAGATGGDKRVLDV